MINFTLQSLWRQWYWNREGKEELCSDIAYLRDDCFRMGGGWQQSHHVGLMNLWVSGELVRHFCPWYLKASTRGKGRQTKAGPERWGRDQQPDQLAAEHAEILTWCCSSSWVTGWVPASGKQYLQLGVEEDCSPGRIEFSTVTEVPDSSPIYHCI